ncbi:hypothetical protein WP4W18C03_27500 [Pseudomonas putida]|nr:hypothetical protein WP4W18C03_27500 [Pseudomonas putida]
MAYAFTKQRMSHRRARAAGAHLYHLVTCHIRQAPAQAFGKAQAVGVVADPLAVFEHDSVHRTDAFSLLRQLIEQRQDRLLERVGDVEAGKPGALGRIQQAGQSAVIQAQLVGVDQPVQVAQGLGVALVLVQRRGPRGLDTTADQPGQDSVRVHPRGSLSSWAKCVRARR